MAEEDAGEELSEELDASLGDAAADDAGDAESGADGEGLDPLAEEMLRMMEEEGGGEGDASSQEDVDRMMEMEMLKAMEEQSDGLAGADLRVGGGGQAPAEGGGVPPNIQRLMDVSMVVSIVLGRTDKTLEEVMDLGEQSLVELDKTVGDPVDIMVNGRLFARGEVVTVSENFGVRITELVKTAGQVL